MFNANSVTFLSKFNILHSAYASFYLEFNALTQDSKLKINKSKLKKM